MPENRYPTWADAGIKTTHTTRQHKTQCPACKDRTSLSVHPAKGAFRCWRPICNYRGWVGDVSASTRTNDAWKPLTDRTDTMQGYADVVKWLTEKRGLPLSLVLNNPDLGVQQFTFRGKDNEPLQRKCVAFRYFDGDALMLCKLRSADKRMTQYPSPTPILYRLNAAKVTDEIIITEGEYDALSFVAAGFDNATSIPNGAADREMRWIENCWEWLEPKGRVYLALDMDVHGRSAMEEIARRVGKHRCWIVSFPDGCNDANDTLIAHGAAALQVAIAAAQPYPIQGINRVSSVSGLLHQYHDHGFEEGAKTGTQLDTLISWQPGELTVWTGHANHGKSPFVSNVMLHLALNGGHKWAFFSPEYKDLSFYTVHMVEAIAGKRLPKNQALTKPELDEAIRFLDAHAYEIRPEDGVYTVDAICELAQALVSQKGISQLVIDHWKKLEFTDGKEQRLAARSMLNRLKALATDLSIHVHLVAHPVTKRFLPKVDTTFNIPPVMSLAYVAESDDFLNLADNGVSIHRWFEDTLSDGKRVDIFTSAFVVKVKNNFVGSCGELQYKFDPQSSRYRPIHSDQDYSFWRPKGIITPDDIRQEIAGFFDDLNGESPKSPQYTATAPF